jgi:hypothetical protein
MRPKSTVLLAVGVLAAGVLAAAATARAQGGGSPQPTNARSCAGAHIMCTEVYDSDAVFGEGNYVGHDEPSVLFYSNRPGSGNSMQYHVTIPSDPAGAFAPSKSYSVELGPTFWFGMALCDTQSYPEQLTKCTPNSDTNIVDPAVSPKHAGTAFMELQFYPPGFVQQFTGFSCDPTRWCVALTIDSLSQNPVTGQALNASCTSRILGGQEYVNFAYLTKTGVPQGPPDPLHFQFIGSGQPDPNKVLLLNQGDQASVTLHDTAHGLLAQVDDLTTGVSGSMIASAANGFGQIKFAPGGGTTQCKEMPYDFHPMYSTSSTQTRVPWTAHSYNIAFDYEIGHFDFCTSINVNTGSCSGSEGSPGDQEPADGDDNACFGAAQSLALPLTGCLDTNTGFDGTSYQPVWPNGDTAHHPTPVLFSSPLTGPAFSTPYDQAAFEADLPRIEAPDFGGSCNRATGQGCTIIPVTDDGAPATFYPYFSTVASGANCRWGVGSTLPGTISDFGKNAQYGQLLPLTYTNGHGTVNIIEDSRNILNTVPC